MARTILFGVGRMTTRQPITPNHECVPVTDGPLAVGATTLGLGTGGGAFFFVKWLRACGGSVGYRRFQTCGL